MKQKKVSKVSELLQIFCKLTAPDQEMLLKFARFKRFDRWIKPYQRANNYIKEHGDYPHTYPDLWI